jgi:hypothetical protein
MIMATRKKWHISDDGQGSGGFLCPPGHWNHRYMLWFGWQPQHAEFMGSIDYEGHGKDLPGAIIARIARIKAEATLVPSEAWMRHVYGYFRNSYAPESGSRNVSDAVIPRKDDDLPPATRHLGCLMVKEFFPDHEPRVDLISGEVRGYGSYPCVHCGKRVQYEPRIDGYLPFVGDQACVKGQLHAW